MFEIFFQAIIVENFNNIFPFGVISNRHMALKIQTSTTNLTLLYNFFEEKQNTHFQRLRRTKQGVDFLQTMLKLITRHTFNCNFFLQERTNPNKKPYKIN